MHTERRMLDDLFRKTKRVYVMERPFCQDEVLYNFCSKSQCSKHPNVVARVAWFDCNKFQKENEFFERTELQVFEDFFVFFLKKSFESYNLYHISYMI